MKNVELKRHYIVVSEHAESMETYPVEVGLSKSLGNNNLIRLSLKNESLYLYAFVCGVYDDSDVVSTPETFIGNVITAGYISQYDEEKIFGEALVKGFEREYGRRIIIVRLYNTYGPRMRGGELIRECNG
jgi:dTDP-glucose 4,6-dehydratase